jgi:competence protein ComEC
MNSPNFIDWKKYPVARLTIPMILGICTNSLAGASTSIYLIGGLSIGLFITFKNQRSGITIFLVSLLFGYGISEVKDQFFNHRAQALNEITEDYRVVINSASSSGNKVYATGREINSGASLQINLNGSLKRPIKIGDTIGFQKSPHLCAPPLDTLEFDFSQWLKTKGISHQVYLKSDQIDVAPLQGFCARRVSNQIAQLISQQIAQHLPNDRYTALISAICLGKKEGITETDKVLFQESGTMHIMAVSGLHVGIISLIFSTLIGQSRSPFRLWLNWALLLLAIWSFIFISGLKTSAIRAGVMFSLFYSGNNLSRESTPINSLLVAAFIILCFDPWQLFQIGFQFSVIAVLSILVFYPLIEPLILGSNNSFLKVKQLLALSISVQILLLPLSIYYFHVFPVYFPLSNLIAIPLATGTLSLGFLTGFVSLFSTTLADAIGTVLFGIFDMSYYLLSLVSKLPFHLITNIWPPLFALILIYLSCTFLVAGFNKNCRYYFRLGILTLMLTFCLTATFRHLRMKKDKWVFYTSKFKDQMDLHWNGQLISFSPIQARRSPVFRSFLCSSSHYQNNFDSNLNYHVGLKELDFIVLRSEVSPTSIPENSVLIVISFVPDCEFIQAIAPKKIVGHNLKDEEEKELKGYCQHLKIELYTIEANVCHEMLI